MNKSLTFLASMGVGAGLMYALDPQMGRRRLNLVRDRALRMVHDAAEAIEVVGKDMQNRVEGLRAGDASVLIGGKRALANPLSGRWSPSGRAVLAGMGLGLVAYGLTRSAPMSCLLGTIGCALMAESATNASCEEIAGAACQVADRARDMAQRSGFMGQADHRASEQQAATGR